MTSASDMGLCPYHNPTVGAVYDRPRCLDSDIVGIEGVNELAMLRNAAEYSPPRRGGVDAPSIKWIRSEIGAAGVVSSAKLFRPKHFAELTTPSAASSVASRLLLMPQPSPLRGGEYLNSTSSHFVHTFHKTVRVGQPTVICDPLTYTNRININFGGKRNHSVPKCCGDVSCTNQ